MKTALVVGATTGIGRSTAEALAKDGWSVILLGRDAGRLESARAEIARAAPGSALDTVRCDLASLAEVRQAAAEVQARHPKLDALVNCAGVFLPKREVTPEGFEKTFVTNYLAHFALTLGLVEVLKAAGPGRIVNVASKTGGATLDFDDLMLERGYSVLKAVPRTKLAQILFTRELARRLAGSGVTVNAMHPGFVKTPLLDEMPRVVRWLFHAMSTKPEKAAAAVVHLVSGADVEGVTGKFFAGGRPVSPGPAGEDDVAARRLWETSAKLAGIDLPAAVLA